MHNAIRAPFPYFGGKSRAAPLIWPRLGAVSNLIIPFFGSGGEFWGGVDMIFDATHDAPVITINDADCMVANFWRAVEMDPASVARHANWPVNEADLHARHGWLVLTEDAAAFRERMKRDPYYFDPHVAGWWCWGLCCWIGGAWCRMTDGPGRRPHLSHGGTGVHASGPKRSMPTAHGRGVTRRMPRSPVFTGVHRNLPQGRPQLGDAYSRGRGVHGNDGAETCAAREAWLTEWFRRLQDRLRTVRVCCGDWKRVCGSRSVTTRLGTTGVMLDPPYLGEVDGEDNRDMGIYANDCAQVAGDVREWCMEHGSDRQMRIALCGLDGEHNELERHGWDVVAWKARGGYGNRSATNRNKRRERIWFSPHCEQVRPISLFDGHG